MHIFKLLLIISISTNVLAQELNGVTPQPSSRTLLSLIYAANNMSYSSLYSTLQTKAFYNHSQFVTYGPHIEKLSDTYNTIYFNLIQTTQHAIEHKVKQYSPTELPEIVNLHTAYDAYVKIHRDNEAKIEEMYIKNNNNKIKQLAEKILFILNKIELYRSYIVDAHTLQQAQQSLYMLSQDAHALDTVAEIDLLKNNITHTFDYCFNILDEIDQSQKNCSFKELESINIAYSTLENNIAHYLNRTKNTLKDINFIYRAALLQKLKNAKAATTLTFGLYGDFNAFHAFITLQYCINNILILVQQD